MSVIPAGGGKYARIEREFRFLLSRVPDGEGVGREITDRYLAGTHLRLRKVVELCTEAVVYKLGQKLPVPEDPASTRITNLYLEPAEYELLAALPAAVLRKRRHRLTVNGRVFAVDAFRDAQEGLVLAECEVEEGEVPGSVSLPHRVAEVTADSRFTGGALAHTTQEELRTLLTEYGLSSQQKLFNRERS